MLGSPETLPREEVIEFVLSCQHPNGGFGSHPQYDPHLLYTLSAVQILFMEDALDRIDIDKVASFVASLQLEDGSFQGDQYGEIDSRFVFTAIQTLSLLDRLSLVNTDKTVEWILRCKNFDGGFGLVPGAESHSAQIFVCVGTLSILNKLDLLSDEDKDTTCWWLAERQTKSGGLNGRPEKLPDVCYSWWVLSALAIFKRLDWIDGDKLRAFILAAQNEDDGGIADREGDEADVFHTIFGIAGLSLLGYEDLELIDPTYCLPAKMIPRIKNFNKTY